MNVSSFSVVQFHTNAVTWNAPKTPDPSTEDQPAEAAAPAPAVDTVELSEPAITPIEPASQPMETSRRLSSALDGDRDGAVSKDEFTSSALALLRHARNRSEASDVAVAKQESRWARRLAKNFDRADGNGDGSIDESEMKAALTASGPRADGRTPMTARRMTVAAVAIQQYTMTAKSL